MLRKSDIAGRREVMQVRTRLLASLGTELNSKYRTPPYNDFKKKETKVLVQLRTGMSHLNNYLY